MSKAYRLVGRDGSAFSSDIPGELGGNARLRIYGRLDCRSARAALPKGYAKNRVFFADEETAIAAGYRPCGSCMRDRYRLWKRGGTAAELVGRRVQPERSADERLLPGYLRERNIIEVPAALHRLAACSL